MSVQRRAGSSEGVWPQGFEGERPTSWPGSAPAHTCILLLQGSECLRPFTNHVQVLRGSAGPLWPRVASQPQARSSFRLAARPPRCIAGAATGGPRAGRAAVARHGPRPL